jgi:hypothetical protein
MAYSQETLVRRVFNLLEITHDFFGAISDAGGIDASVTTVGVNDGTEWADGDLVEFQPDGELARVTGVSANNLTVVRGVFGTTAATHADTDSIIKNPAITRQMVKDSIQETFQGLWPMVWKVGTDTVTPLANTEWYDTDALIMDLVAVNQLWTSGSTTKLGIFGDKGGEKPVIFSKNLPTALVASGKGIAFPGGIYHVSNNINITYRTPFLGSLSGSNYSEISDGPAVDVLAYGAATRIAMGKEAPKTVLEDQAQGEHNTGAGDRLALATFLDNKFRRALNNWSDQLWLESPPMGVVA